MQLLLVLLSMACAVLPILAFLLVVWWMDRYEREPLWLVAMVFAWGAVGGIMLGLFVSLLLQAPLGLVLSAEQASAFSTVFIAPLAEEPAKALVLFAVYFSRQFDNTTDGFVYGAAAGLGFGMTENFMYFVGAAAEGDVAGWAGTVLIRTLYSALMHAGASSMIGAALGFMKFRGPLTKLVALPTAFCMAMGMHALWNGLLTLADLQGNAGLAAANLLLFPLEFFALVVVLQLCLLDESRTILRELAPEVERGLIPAAHLRVLSSYLKRGRRGWLERGVDHHAYVHAATTLAFRKHQALRWPGHLDEDVAALRDEIRGLLRGARA